jgi:hypothetical protein
VVEAAGVRSIFRRKVTLPDRPRRDLMKSFLRRFFEKATARLVFRFSSWAEYGFYFPEQNPIL